MSGGGGRVDLSECHICNKKKEKKSQNAYIFKQSVLVSSECAIFVSQAVRGQLVKFTEAQKC